MKKDAKKLNVFYENETTAFYKSLSNNGGYRLDREFACPDDEPLTKQEIAQIDAYWGKYKFAYPNINYKSFQTFKNRSGRFDVRHCPGEIKTVFFRKYFDEPKYNVVCQNKAMFDFLYSNLPRPRTVARRMNGLYMDEDYRPLSLDEIVTLCSEHLRTTGGLIVKPNASSGGSGIVVFQPGKTTDKEIRKHLSVTLGICAFVIQEILVQSDFMARFNPSSVNTIRINTILHKGRAKPLAALCRIGSKGSNVDNWCSGGSLLGVDINTGKCLSEAMTNDHKRITKLPSGVNLAEENLVIPNFEKLKEMVCLAHYRVPYIKMISWDMALDHNNEPTFIECNFAGMIQIHEATTGPLFGDLMDELLDEYCLKRFFLHFVTEDFICREYHDHVVVEEYIGVSGDVKVPEVLKGKPVTRIMPKAFEGCDIRRISASKTIVKNSPTAMKSIR